MFIVNIIEVSSNGRSKLLEKIVKTDTEFATKKELDQYHKKIWEEKSQEYKNEDVNIYFHYTEK